MPRRADHRALDPGHIPRAMDLDPRHIVAVVICRDHHAVATALERLGLLPDPDVVPVIGEEAGWRDHQDRMRQSVPLLILDFGFWIADSFRNLKSKIAMGRIVPEGCGGCKLSLGCDYSDLSERMLL